VSESYQVIGVVVLGVLAVTIVALILAHVIGPSRHGAQKDSPYESGVPVVHDIHRRFNIRFYIIAMLFLLFDVELLFIWPWALAFYRSCVGGPVAVPGGDPVGQGFLLVGMGIFFAILVLGLVYEWKKGAFQWD